MRHVALVLALVACGKSEKSEPAPSTAPAKPDMPSVDKPSVDTADKAKRFCRRLDTDPVAKILGIAELNRTGGGSLVKGGGEPPVLACSYYEAGKTDGGMSFGVSIKQTTEFDQADPLKRFTWEAFDGLGQPAKIGRGKDRVHIQTVVKGVLLTTDVDHQTIPVAELEPKLVAAMKYVIEQLPADATVEVR